MIMLTKSTTRPAAPRAPRLHTVPTGLGALAVTEIGEGPPLVLWHSLLVDGRSFEAVTPALSARRRLLVIDGPDHGQSVGPADARSYTLDDCADAALAVLDALGLERVDWVGHAWGGHVGAVLAARRTGRLRSLAAIGSPMQAAEGRLKLGVLIFLYRLLGVRGPVRAGLEQAMLHPARVARDPELRRRFLSIVEDQRRPHLTRAMRSVMLGRPSIVDRLERIDVPTLLVTGDDPLWPIELMRAQAARIPNARAEYLGETCHMQPMEDPGGFLALVEGFLDGVP